MKNASDLLVLAFIAVIVLVGGFEIAKIKDSQSEKEAIELSDDGSEYREVSTHGSALVRHLRWRINFLETYMKEYPESREDLEPYVEYYESLIAPGLTPDQIKIKKLKERIQSLEEEIRENQ